MAAETTQAEAAQAEVEIARRQCPARNKDGTPCGAVPPEGKDYCFFHDPELASERAKARRKGGVNRRRPSGTEDVGPVSLRSPQEVLGLIERAVADCLALENSVARARAIGYLSGLSLKALEVGEFEERLEALERAMGQRDERDRVGGEVPIVRPEAS